MLRPNVQHNRPHFAWHTQAITDHIVCCLSYLGVCSIQSVKHYIKINPYKKYTLKSHRKKSSVIAVIFLADKLTNLLLLMNELPKIMFITET